MDQSQAAAYLAAMMEGGVMDTEYTRDAFVPGIEVIEGRSGEPTKLVGYAAVFNQETVIYDASGGWRERIMPSAFADVLMRDDVIAAVNHDDSMVLGRSKRGTLLLSTDDRGLRYEVRLPNTTLARDTIENVRNGNYAGSSFRFSLAADGMRVVPPTRSGELSLVFIERVKSLKDVGPVTFPAYEGTSVNVRSMAKLVSSVIDSQAAIVGRDLAALRIRIDRERTWAP